MLFLFFIAGIHHNLVLRKRKPTQLLLDAGHGGNDPGNIGNGYREKNIALKSSFRSWENN